MLRFILLIIGLVVIMCKPFLLFLAAAVGLMWLLISRPTSFPALDSLLAGWGARVNEPEPDLSRRKDFMTYEEREEKIMSNIKFKEGFEDDPKWQEQSKRFREQIQKAQDLEDEAMRVEGQNIKNMA